MTRADSLPIAEDLAERLRVEGEASDQAPPVLAASLIDEGLKTRQFPGIVFMDGTAGRRACLSGGPDVWQIIRALREVPAADDSPVRTVCIESDLHSRQVELAIRYWEAYPEEIEAMIAKDVVALDLIDEMISDRERGLMLELGDEFDLAISRDDDSGLSI